MRVLVVEDEVRIADFVSRGLTEEGYAVDIASDGEEALQWADVTDFDVIVLDLMLPGRDGIDVCRTLRVRGVRTPILMLTARDAVEDRVRGVGQRCGRLSGETLRLCRATSPSSSANAPRADRVGKRAAGGGSEI